jgi:hypothetical protein
MELYSDIYFMNEALKEARKAYDADEVPVGVVIVAENKIIAKVLQINSARPRVNPIYPASINRIPPHILCRLFIDCAVIVCIYNFGDPHVEFQSP